MDIVINTYIHALKIISNIIVMVIFMKLLFFLSIVTESSVLEILNDKTLATFSKIFNQ